MYDVALHTKLPILLSTPLMKCFSSFRGNNCLDKVNFFDEFHFDKYLFSTNSISIKFWYDEFCFDKFFSINFFSTNFFRSIQCMKKERVQIWTIRRKVKKGLTRFWRKNLILFYIFILCSLSNTLVNGKESHDKEISSQVISIKERKILLLVSCWYLTSGRALLG